DPEAGSLHVLFTRAMAAANAKFAAGFGQFNAYSNQDKGTRIFPAETADRLFLAIRQNHGDKAHETLDLIADGLASATYRDFLQHIRILCYRILRFLQDLESPDLQILMQKVRSNPETLETLDSFRRLFHGILDTLVAEYHRIHRKSLVHLNGIERRIEDSFRDPAFCVHVLADDMKLSPNYLRQIYKAGTGRSLSEEITRTRIEEAARLLCESEAPVKELYRDAGFTSYNSFITSFKKFKGLTPDAFRRKR
ncbi:MAG: AraC family transcriptional regulator, partial [Desulfobacterales bacterium]|nr:AraC family transcriptional regulator [Desulfobacterales bacterium]